MAECRRIAAQIGATWCAVYIGGPESAGAGWTPDLVRALAAVLADGFLPVYVGRQAAGPLTAAQGAADALEATSLMPAFGFPPGSPVVLDVEAETYQTNPTACAEYVDAWTATIRQRGFRAGVYGSPSCLPNVDKDFAWLAGWDHTSAAEGCAIHQYSGNTYVAGWGVDLDVEDSFELACLT